jgi:uroporphyrinogen-III decarboxylase
LEEAMSRYERIEAAWNLKEADRVPVDPLNCYIYAYLGGITIREMFTEPEKIVQATIKARKILGEGDQVDPNITTLDHFSLWPKSGWDRVTLHWRIYDEFPPKGNIPNFFEKLIIEDYDDVMERGFATILFNKKISEDIFQRSIDEALYYAFEYPKKYAEAWKKYVEKYEVPLMMGGRACTPLDLLQYYRGITKLARDLFERPEKVKEVCEWLLDYEVTLGMKEAMIMGAGEVPGAEKIIFINGGPPGMSPKIFEEFFWPTAKKGVDIMVKRGFKVHCHWDGNLTPVLDILKDLTKGLPKGKVLLDLEKTDMKKAKEILGDKVCLYGNVPSSLLVYGTPKDVEKYCKKLIEDCAEGGGFILSTECEVPWNSKPENVRAIIEAAIKYGQYKR